LAVPTAHLNLLAKAEKLSKKEAWIEWLE